MEANYFTILYWYSLWRESATGVHVFPFQNPLPTSLPIPSLWVIPVHQPWALCTMHGITLDIHVSMTFSQFIPPLPSPTDSKRLFYTSGRLSYPFVCRWTSRLLPCLGYYKQCCDEYWGTRVSFRFGFLGVYAQEWDCYCLLNFYAAYIRWNAGLNEAQDGIKIAGRKEKRWLGEILTTSDMQMTPP